MKKKIKIIGLTGGIGSGKSSVLQLFKNKGLAIYNADIEAKLLMQENHQLIKKITDYFGKEAYESGQLNRKYLAHEVFKNPEKLKVLNALVHPVVRKHFQSFIKKQKSPIVILENAILFESGMDQLCDAVITITAPTETRIQRIMQRDGVSKQQVLDRMNNQIEDHLKMKKSDFVIENIRWEQTAQEVEKIYKEILPEHL